MLYSIEQCDSGQIIALYYRTLWYWPDYCFIPQNSMIVAILLFYIIEHCDSDQIITVCVIEHRSSGQIIKLYTVCHKNTVTVAIWLHRKGETPTSLLESAVDELCRVPKVRLDVEAGHIHGGDAVVLDAP